MRVIFTNAFISSWSRLRNGNALVFRQGKNKSKATLTVKMKEAVILDDVPQCLASVSGLVSFLGFLIITVCHANISF